MANEASQKMADLLSRLNVRHSNFTGLNTTKFSWKELWSRFCTNPSKFERLRGCLQNRWFIRLSRDPEDSQRNMMAAKTLMGLILWGNLFDLL